MSRPSEVLRYWVIALVAGAAAGVFLWMNDPPWRVRGAEGSVISFSAPQVPWQMITAYYKTALLVRTDDGRTVGVRSQRSAPPAIGERVFLQERFGMLGTHTFVEVPKP
jgi:hypothetical protein